LYKLQPCRPQLSKFRGIQAQEQPTHKAAKPPSGAHLPACSRGR
jgi:hypothetical protein